VLLNESVPQVTGQFPLGLVLFFLVLLLCSAFFAGSETALSTVNRIRMLSYADDGDRRARRVIYILDHFEEALSALQGQLRRAGV
jgi:Mg2+/Co2+ transporter CorB